MKRKLKDIDRPSPAAGLFGRAHGQLIAKRDARIIALVKLLGLPSSEADQLPVLLAIVKALPVCKGTGLPAFDSRECSSSLRAVLDPLKPSMRKQVLEVVSGIERADMKLVTDPAWRRNPRRGSPATVLRKVGRRLDALAKASKRRTDKGSN